MIKRLVIRNWQSLRHVDLDLGRLTIIVGASSSGKSALIRALKALASNARGTSVITRGATSAEISAHLDDTVIVTLEHTKGSWKYRLTRNGHEELYAKPNKAVPEDITAALRIDPVPTGGVSLNFAGQFDRPYLVSENSAASVARTLGELTNVDTIFQAVREANRRRQAHATTLRARETDLANYRAQAVQFATLPARLAACAEAESRAALAHRLLDQIRQLHAAIDTLAVAETVLARTTRLPDVPSDQSVCTAHERLNGFKALARDWAAATTSATFAKTAAINAADEEAALHDELHAVLVEAGTCPTCQRPIEA
jgi:energy-coupling factor transporter ATP-binding protein EcfA2